MLYKYNVLLIIMKITLTIVRVVNVVDKFPSVVADDVNDSVMIIRPQAYGVVDQTRCRRNHLNHQQKK